MWILTAHLGGSVSIPASIFSATDRGLESFLQNLSGVALEVL